MCSQSPLNIHEYIDKKNGGTFLGAQGSMNKETDIQNTVSLFVIIILVNKKTKEQGTAAHLINTNRNLFSWPNVWE